MPYIYASMDWVTIGPCNGLSPVRRLEAEVVYCQLDSSEHISVKFESEFSFKKMQLKLSSVKMAAILSRWRWVNMSVESKCRCLWCRVLFCAGQFSPQSFRWCLADMVKDYDINIWCWFEFSVVGIISFSMQTFLWELFLKFHSISQVFFLIFHSISQIFNFCQFVNFAVNRVGTDPPLKVLTQCSQLQWAVSSLAQVMAWHLKQH